MTSHAPFATEDFIHQTASASGARFNSIRTAIALEFLQRIGEVTPSGLDRAEAWGAFEDRTSLIAVGAMAQSSRTAFRAHVAVVPERRRLGIGAELLRLLIREASERGVTSLSGSHPASAKEPRLLVNSLSVISARRVQGEHAEVVIFISKAASTGSGGQR